MSVSADVDPFNGITSVIALARLKANRTVLKIAEAIIATDPTDIATARSDANDGLAELKETADLLTGRMNAQTFNGDVFSTILAAKCVDESFVNAIVQMVAAMSDMIDLSERDLSMAREQFGALSQNVLATIVQINTALQQISEYMGASHKSADSGQTMMTSLDGALADMGKRSNSISMLAINASTEANRAGERGGAFGVLAREMHRQATQSRQTLEKARQAMGRGVSSRI